MFRSLRRSLVVSILLASGLSACGGETPAVPPAANSLRVVQAVTVREGPAEPPINATGSLANRDEARLSFKVGGVIATLRVREGARVKAGEVLAELETVEVDAGVQQAREAYGKSARDLQRGQQLFADDVITREALDDLGTAAAVAKAGLNSVEFNRRYARIVAPADGRVLRRLADERELVTPGQPILLVSSGSGRTDSGTVGGLVLRVGLTDRDVVRVQPGDAASLAFDALPERSFEGRITEIGGSADPRTGTYRVEIAVTAAAEALASGMVGRAAITPTMTAANARTYLPLEGLVEGDQQRARIYLLEAGNRVREAEVAVAFVIGDEAALRVALPPGTQVITRGAAYLRNGETVRLAEDPAGPVAAAEPGAAATALAPTAKGE